MLHYSIAIVCQKNDVRRITEDLNHLISFCQGQIDFKSRMIVIDKGSQFSEIISFIKGADINAIVFPLSLPRFFALQIADYVCTNKLDLKTILYTRSKTIHTNNGKLLFSAVTNRLLDLSKLEEMQQRSYERDVINILIEKLLDEETAIYRTKFYEDFYHHGVPWGIDDYYLAKTNTDFDPSTIDYDNKEYSKFRAQLQDWDQDGRFRGVTLEKLFDGFRDKGCADQQEFGPHLVMLLHGINTYADWTLEIKDVLSENGLVPSASSFGFLSVAKFLFPIDLFRDQAVEKFISDVRIAINLSSAAKVSVIAHSFGTFVVSKAMLRAPDIKWNRIIFCGSVVKSDFPFDQLLNRFRAPLLNEVGSNDIWPAVAESVTWGYGYVGSHGLNHPMVTTRWHSGFKHSDFLTRDVCERYWIPFLNNGDIVKGDKPSSFRIKRIISLMKIRYWIVAITVWALIIMSREFISI